MANMPAIDSAMGDAMERANQEGCERIDTSPRDMTIRVWEGDVKIADDFDELPPELLDAFTVKLDEPAP